jgi:hypothetical protein
MSFDSAAVQNLFDLVQSKVQQLAVVDSVNTVEPKSAPQNNLTCAIWIQEIIPVRTSGLNVTSALVTFTVRIYSNMLRDAQDEIDPNITQAVTSIIDAFSGSFELKDDVTQQSTARMVDLLGAYGNGLSAKAGYLSIQQKMFRIMDISLPVVINDCWSQVA